MEQVNSYFRTSKEGFPNIIWSGVDNDRLILVMDLLGHSLEYYFSLCNNKLSLKSVIMIAD